MFLIRQSKPADVATLLKLARMVFFINLPPDDRIIADKIAHSTRCIRRLAGLPDAQTQREGSKHRGGYASTAADSDVFMFTMEDVESGGVVGTCQIKARMGGPGNPNFAFKLEERKFHSDSLNFGTTHTIAKLHRDESGPTEVGGLILSPSVRGGRLKPGRLLSFVRFHFIGLYRQLFADRILAEMMAQVSSEGDNVFWDAIGRKFIPVRYSEADRFCQHNRQFIEELLPADEIYLTLLPLEVLNTVGQVSRETVPARRMLEKLGFTYKGFIDPFDGGPHLDAITDEIDVVRTTRRLTLGKAIDPAKAPEHGIVSVLNADGEFRALETDVLLEGKSLRLSKQAMHLLGASAGAEIGFTPLSRPDAPEPQKRVASADLKPAAGKSREKRTKSASSRPRAAKPV
ncbi:MAG: arginine N-succinyltransferase [Planctomycetota bacterium]|nr:arginine N-succinyltransferase [Planctomycetota bacterium]